MTRTTSTGAGAGKPVTPKPPRGIKPRAKGARTLAAEMEAQTEATHRAWSLLLATQLGLMQGATRHINARVPARLLEAATARAGADAVTEVVTRALAGLATRSELGPWLAEHWGALHDVDPAVAAEIDTL